MFSIMLAVLERDFLALSRKRSDWLMPLAFFTVFVAVFPLAIDIRQQALTPLIPAIVWISALLVNVLTLDKIFKDDYANGSLEQMMIMSFNLFPMVIAKVFSHWCAMQLPLLIFAPLYAYMLNLPSAGLMSLIIVLLLATPVLSLLGTLGAALTIGVRQSGVLLALLMLPLYVPLLIFSANAVSLASQGLEISAIIAILGAILIVSVLLLPLFICAALRITMS